MISSAILNKQECMNFFAKTNKCSLGSCNLWSLKNLQVLIYSKLHKKNHVIKY